MADQQNPFGHLNAPTEPQPQPVPVTRGVVVRNPAAAQEARAERGEARAETSLGLEQERLGITREGEARQAREEVRGSARELRTEFRGLPVVKDYEQAIPNFTAALRTAPTGTGDLALVYYFAKTIDPGSAVQQGEMDNIQSTDARLPAAVQTALRELRASDGRFTDAAREGLRRELLGIITQRNLAYRSARDQYRQLAQSPEYGIDPNLVIGEHIGSRYVDQINEYFQARRDQEQAQQERERPLEASGLGETFMTPEDRELQSRLQAAWGTATLEQLQAIAAEYNRTIPLGSQAELDEVRRQGRGIAADPSGRRTGLQSVLGRAAETSPGAYFIGAANALTSGGLDEIAGALGMDAEAVQAGKEALRERYPVASFTGEVSGQVLQAIPVMRGAQAVGLGARGLGALEVAQGAAYGAGEANEDRLLGAGAGALGTLAGQQISSRFIEPGVRAVIDRISGQTGAPREAVEQLVQEAFGPPVPPRGGAQVPPGGVAPTPEVPPVGAAAPTTSPIPAGAAAPTPAPRAPSAAEQQGISEEMVALARRAAGRGPGSRAAREELRAAVEADPTIVQAAESLGLELPADVFSANVQLRNLTGLARSQPGSAADAGWQQTVANSARQVEESLTEMGASRDLAGLSDEVFTRLNNNMESLQRQGDELREAVNANLNMQSRVEATNLQDALAQTINDLGGIEEATQAMTSQERRLLRALGIGETPKQPTYAYMDRLRREIGDALNKGTGPWADTERVTLQRYYNALADDRIAHVARELGQDAADDLAASNQIFQAMYAARDEMTNLFGRDLDKGIGRQIQSVVSQGARGDTTNLRRLIAAIPEDMRADVAFSGILANARAAGPNGGFGFRQFNAIYRGIRENEPVYRELARNMTESQRTFLDNLYAVSQGIADADNRIIRTGRARGGPAEEINARSLTGAMMDAAARRGVGSAATGTGALLGGPAGAAAGFALDQALARLTRGSASNLDRVSEVIGSAAYRDLVNEAGRGGNMTRAINRLANSKPFGLFARGLGLNTQEARRAWISSALAVGATQQVGGEPAQADSQAIMVETQ